MAKTIDWLLEKYEKSHRNPVNQVLHLIAIPLTLFSLLGLLYALPFVGQKSMFTNWAAIFLAATLLYYLRFSLPIFLGLLLVSGLMLYGLDTLLNAVGRDYDLLAVYSMGLFAIAWFFVILGYQQEGKYPAILERFQFMLIGPAWLLVFLFKMVGIQY